MIKWKTLSSKDGHRSIKQHAFTGVMREDKIGRIYAGNESLCGQITATREGPKELRIDQIKEEELDEGNFCRKCLKIYNKLMS